MKRTGNIFEKVIDLDNLFFAFKQAMRGCRRTNEICRFFFRLENEILELRREIESGRYRPGKYRLFTIHDPKTRIIAEASFRDRVVHHAVVNVLTPIYEKVFIYDSYATRRFKGTHAAIKRAQKFSKTHPWYLKADVEKYFDSVDHEIIMQILAMKIKDRQFLDLMDIIIRNTSSPGKGLPIGNLTSQFLANVYLDPLDHHIKDRLGVKGYLRYMDDFVLFHGDKKTLLQLRDEISRFLDERLKIELNSRATYVNRSQHGLSFLGMRIFPGLIRVRPENRRRSIKRLRQRIEAWEKGKLDELKMTQSIECIIAHLSYFCPDACINLDLDLEI